MAPFVTLTLSLVVFSVGCASAPEVTVAPLSAAPLLPADTPAIRHAPSGMMFPARLAGLERDAISAHDPAGDDLSVGYHRLDEAVALAATIYVYPASGALDRDFEAAKAAVVEQRPGSALIAEGEMSLEQSGTWHGGWRAHFLVRDPHGDLPPQISHLFLFQHGPWRIKYRATFLAHQHEEADHALLRFMRELPWPEIDLGVVAALEGSLWEGRAGIKGRR